jgi:hypothetical protein
VAAPAIRAPRSSIEARNQKRGSFGTGWCAHLGRITTGRGRIAESTVAGSVRRRGFRSQGGGGSVAEARGGSALLWGERRAPEAAAAWPAVASPDCGRLGPDGLRVDRGRASGGWRKAGSGLRARPS